MKEDFTTDAINNGIFLYSVYKNDTRTSVIMGEFLKFKKMEVKSPLNMP